MAQVANEITWSVRCPPGEHGAATLDHLRRACRQICSDTFPDHAGYLHTHARLSGPVQGHSITIDRGPFHALVSVQRYRRLGPSAGSLQPEIRLVAAARRESRALAVCDTPSSIHWGVAAGAIASLGVAALLLELAGVLPGWSQLLLLIPALMAWRVCLALRFAASLRQQRALPAASDAPRARRYGCRDQERWAKAGADLAQLRDAVVPQVGLRPFRSARPRADAEPSAVTALPVYNPGT